MATTHPSISALVRRRLVMSVIVARSRVMSSSGTFPSPEETERMREAYRRDVAVLPPREVRNVIVRGGFDLPVPFFQAGMIHAWYARRSTR